MCGLLGKSLYGTRDAAQNWAEAYMELMVSIGFEKGKSCPCAFVHQKRELRAVVHGDDFMSVGKKEDLRWLQGKMQGRFTITTEIIGMDKDAKK